MSDGEWDRVARAAAEWLPAADVDLAIERGTQRGAVLLRRRLWWMWALATIAVVALAGLALVAHAALGSTSCPGSPGCEPAPEASASPSIGTEPTASPMATASSAGPSPSSMPSASGMASASSVASASPTRTASPPAVSGLTPSAGPEAGGTSVTLTGSGFTDPATVQIGGMPPVDASVTSSGDLTFVTPALSAGLLPGEPLDVVVSTEGGSSASNPQATFTYVPRPAVTDARPAEGPASGGQKVEITGTGLSGATAVTFGDLPADLAARPTDAVIVVIAPPLADLNLAGVPLDIRVTTPGGQSDPSPGATFTYLLPQPRVTGITPDHGSVSGGTAVTITGSGLATVTDVFFGSIGVPVTPASDGEIDVLSPAYPDSITVDTPVPVTVRSPAGEQAAGGPTSFTYDGPIIE